MGNLIVNIICLWRSFFEGIEDGYYEGQAAQITQPVLGWVVKDRFTKNQLYRGTQEDCSSYINAFGNCFMENN